MNIVRKLPFVFIFVLLGLVSFTLPKNIEKKVSKEIKKTFEVEGFALEAIQVTNEINKQLQHKIGVDNLFKIIVDSELLGYAYVSKAPSKTDEFDYLVLLDTDLIVKKTSVLIYREDYGGEIGSKRWLKQFTGKTTSDVLVYEKDVVAISGATISAMSMTNAVNIFLQDLKILHNNQVL